MTTNDKVCYTTRNGSARVIVKDGTYSLEFFEFGTDVWVSQSSALSKFRSLNRAKRAARFWRPTL